MKNHKAIRLDKFFGVAALISILVFAVMIYSDFFVSSKENTGSLSAGKDTAGGQKNSQNDQDNGTETSSGKLTVCIDAARGGKDTGLTNGSNKEKDITLEIAGLVASKLEAHNIKVVMTRTTDEDVSDESRARIWNASDVNVCFALRMNSYNKDTSVSGAEVYIHTKQPEESVKFADDILTSISKETGMKNRGIRSGTASSDKDNYYINAHSRCISCVVNMGFISNTSDLNMVTTQKDKMAQAIADGIVNYFKQAGVY